MNLLKLNRKEEVFKLVGQWTKNRSPFRDWDAVKQTVLAALEALNWETCIASDVEKIIGGVPWRDLECSECGLKVEQAVEIMTETGDGYAHDILLCPTCIRKASELVRNTA